MSIYIFPKFSVAFEARHAQRAKAMLESLHDVQINVMDHPFPESDIPCKLLVFSGRDTQLATAMAQGMNDGLYEQESWNRPYETHEEHPHPR